MELVELSPQHDELVAQAVALENTAAAVDSPWVHPTTPRRFLARLTLGWDLEPSRYVAGLVDGRLVALGQVATSEWDNRDFAWLDLVVDPAVRRQGHGTEMFSALEATSAGLGRTKLGCGAWDGTSGVDFARSRGMEHRSQAVNRRQHLAEIPSERIRALHDQAVAVASAYELVRIAGRTPEAMLGDLARLSESINDAPLDDLELEDEAYPPERVRDYETAQLDGGHRLYRLVARHRETGELAGHTVVAVEVERPAIGHQHDTTVAREHRGHRLGLLLKAGMNLWLADEEPGLETVDTWNAESNDHMIAVNEALGYRAMGRVLHFQR